MSCKHLTNVANGNLWVYNELMLNKDRMMKQSQPFLLKQPQKQASPGLLSRVGELRAGIEAVPGELLSTQTGASFLMLGPSRGEFHFSFLDLPVIGAYPELIFFTSAGDKLPEFQQALLMYYFAIANGAPLSGNWVSFADLPDGRMYNQAFQGYSGDVLRDTVSNDLTAFESACLALGGKPLELGSASFVFPALPRVPLLVTFWLGDDDFPSSCKVLFDASATNYLPIDGCAILGSQLTGKIAKKLSALKS